MDPTSAFPRLIFMLTIGVAIAFFFELAAGSVTGQADPIATGGLGTVLAACISALAIIYTNQARRPPPDPPAERNRLEATGDRESDDWNRDRGYLEFGRTGRWRSA